MEVTSSPSEAIGAKAAFATLVVGGVAALVLLSFLFEGVKTNFEDAATFGADTVSGFAKVDGYPIHCMDGRDSVQCLAGANIRKAERSVLWLGNSQVHAVNQLRAGETNAPPILFETLKNRGLDLLAFSQPNANLQEHYVLFQYLSQQLPLKVLVLPLVFDDMREDGLRDEVAIFARDKSTAAELSKTKIGQRLVEAAQTVPEDVETVGIANTLQERAERGLNDWLEKHSPLWQARPEIRGHLFLGLYQFRNTLFGIKATSKRKLIPGRYRANWAALNAIMSEAERKNIHVVLYVSPLRGGVEVPYDEDEYARFKAEVELLANRYGALYSNLEALIPDELWGKKAATTLGGGDELDFMHFQAGGHKLLAKKLDSLVAEVISQQANRQ